MYEYEYEYTEIKRCNLCNKLIELRYCILVEDGSKFYFHKGCLHKFYNDLLRDA